MRKISLLLVSIFFVTLSMFSQTDGVQENNYENKKLQVEEVNILGSYYTQDGNNSGVTGGIGTEKLTDYSSSIDVKLQKYTAKGNKHAINFNVGVDYYTSASSDNIESYVFPTTSASYSDKRIYPSVNYKFMDNEKNQTYGGGLYYSHEFDYFSKGANLAFSKEFNDKNTEISAKATVFLDELSVIRPYELRDFSKPLYKYDIASRNSYSLALALNQVLSKRVQMSFLADIISQSGVLSTTFNRVYFKGSTASALEVLPDNRIKVPLGIRANMYLNDRMILRNFYRFYIDNWGILSNTLQAELALKICKSLTLIPSVRLYHQQGAKYFGAYQTLDASSTYHTSDYDLSSFTSALVSSGIRIKPENGIFFKTFNALEIKYGYYTRSNNLSSHVVSVNMKFK